MRLRTRSASAALALALAVAATAHSAATASTPAPRAWVVEPGTEVALVEDHRAPLVGVVVEFPVGRWSPWAVAHHASEAFEIQLHDPAGSLRRRADRLAAEIVVEMGPYAARVEASCLREDLEPLMELIGDVLRNEDLDRRELRRRRKKAKLTWDGALKDPQFRLAQAAARLAYADDDPRRRRYERPRPMVTDPRRLIPVRDTIVRLPGRTIGFAGDVGATTVERLSRGLLPPVIDEPPPGLEPRLGAMTAPDRLPGERTVAMPRIAQTFFGYGRPSLTYDDPRYPAFLVADHVLGGHFFSRLYVALRHEGGETYGATTTGRGGMHAEIYALTTFTRGDNTQATERKLRDVLERFHAEGITEDERQAAVGYLLGRRAFARRSPAQILDRFLEERRHGLPPGFRDELAEQASRVSVDEVNAFIGDYYDPGRFVMVKVVPR